MRVAAFDLSSKTGVAVWDGNAGRPTLWTKKLTGYDYAVEDTLELWRLWLGDFIKTHRPEFVVIEEYVVTMYRDAANAERAPRINGEAVFRLCNLSGFTRWCLKMAGIKHVVVTPAQWRKHAFGSARNNGTDWKVRAKGRCNYLGWPYDDDNSAEAGLILDWAISSHLRINPPWRDDTLLARIS